MLEQRSQLFAGALAKLGLRSNPVLRRYASHAARESRRARRQLSLLGGGLGLRLAGGRLGGRRRLWRRREVVLVFVFRFLLLAFACAGSGLLLLRDRLVVRLAARLVLARVAVGLEVLAFALGARLVRLLLARRRLRMARQHSARERAAKPAQMRQMRRTSSLPEITITSFLTAALRFLRPPDASPPAAPPGACAASAGASSSFTMLPKSA